jgi:hypothetical protein
MRFVSSHLRAPRSRRCCASQYSSAKTSQSNSEICWLTQWFIPPLAIESFLVNLHNRKQIGVSESGAQRIQITLICICSMAPQEFAIGPKDHWEAYHLADEINIISFDDIYRQNAGSCPDSSSAILMGYILALSQNQHPRRDTEITVDVLTAHMKQIPPIGFSTGRSHHQMTHRLTYRAHQCSRHEFAKWWARL